MANRFDQAKRYTEKYKGALPPCKYCGNTNIVISSDRTIFNPRNVWAVCCTTRACDSTADFTKVKDAVKAWQERHGERAQR